MASGTNGASNSSGQQALDRFARMMIERMEKMRASDWEQGWIGGASSAGLPRNIMGRNYSGSNSFFLRLHTAAQGYELPVFLTFKQAHNFKAHVLKGEKAFPVIYWDMMVRDKDGKRISSDEYRAMSHDERKNLDVIPFVKAFPVYNIDQTNFREAQPERVQKLLDRFKVPEMRDTIIVSNRRDKASQTFFRRDSSKGDVVSFIRENLSSLNVIGLTEWQKIAKVMAQFANMPEPDYDRDRDYVRSASAPQVFDPSRYRVKDLDATNIPRLFAQRGLSADTVKALAPFISLVSDRRNENFNGYNIGFPYTEAGSDKTVGYEIRGMGGYKSKAAGTNSSTAAWVADLSHGNNGLVRHVFFCESAFDAMAFFRMNRPRLGEDIALVSLGGTFSDRQVLGVMERFPNARAYDCFDNDLAGRINGLRLMALVEDIPLKITKTPEGLMVEAKGKSFPVSPDRSAYTQFEPHISVRYRMGQWQPPKDFKDWNDCLLGKRSSIKILPTKHDRDDNLAEQRASGLKI